MDNYLITNFENQERKSLRDAFGESIVKLGEQSENIVILSADLTKSIKLEGFKNRFTNRFFQVGVAEQNMVAIAAGLAKIGKIPFCCSFATFLTGRAWEQIRVLISANNLPVKLIGSHAGLSHPHDGFTAQATEDIALMRVLPNMVVIYPADANQMDKASLAIYKHQGPVYLRMLREPTAVFIKNSSEFIIGKAQVLKSGKDITIISAGALLGEVISAAKETNLDCEIINMHTIKPIDSETIIQSTKKTNCVLTIEDHQIEGGLGSAVAEVLIEFLPVKVFRLGLDNQFGRTARSYQELLQYYHLDKKSLVKKIKETYHLKHAAKT